MAKDQLEFEVQFARDGDNPGLDKFHVHIRCFAASEFELGTSRGRDDGRNLYPLVTARGDQVEGAG